MRRGVGHPRGHGEARDPVAFEAVTAASAEPAAGIAAAAGGGAGSCMRVGPADDLCVVYRMQSPKQRLPHRAALRERVCGAVADTKRAAGRQAALERGLKIA